MFGFLSKLKKNGGGMTDFAQNGANQTGDESGGAVTAVPAVGVTGSQVGMPAVDLGEVGQAVSSPPTPQAEPPVMPGSEVVQPVPVVEQNQAVSAMGVQSSASVPTVEPVSSVAADGAAVGDEQSPVVSDISTVGAAQSSVTAEATAEGVGVIEPSAQVPEAVVNTEMADKYPGGPVAEESTPSSLTDSVVTDKPIGQTAPAVVAAGASQTGSSADISAQIGSDQPVKVSESGEIQSVEGSSLPEVPVQPVVISTKSRPKFPWEKVDEVPEKNIGSTETLPTGVVPAGEMSSTQSNLSAATGLSGENPAPVEQSNPSVVTGQSEENLAPVKTKTHLVSE